MHLPSMWMLETLEKLITPKSVILLDTCTIHTRGASDLPKLISSYVQKTLDDILPIIKKEKEWLKEVAGVFSLPATIVVLLEVHDELGRNIRCRINNFNRFKSTVAHLNCQNKYEESINVFGQYIDLLEKIYNQSELRDPRYRNNALGVVHPLDTKSSQYAYALQHNLRESLRIHDKKRSKPSATDANIATVAYVLQKEGYDISIVSRDKDFIPILRNMHVGTLMYALKDTQESVRIFSKAGEYCIALYNSDFSDGFYTQRKNIPILDYPFQTKRNFSMNMLEKEVWGNEVPTNNLRASL